MITQKKLVCTIKNNKERNIDIIIPIGAICEQKIRK